MFKQFTKRNEKLRKINNMQKVQKDRENTERQ